MLISLERISKGARRQNAGGGAVSHTLDVWRPKGPGLKGSMGGGVENISALMVAGLIRTRGE